MTPSCAEDTDAATLSTLLQILRYQPTVIAHMEDLLDAVASHLPRVIARYIVESPMSGPLAMPIEGTVVFADIDGFTQLSEGFARAASEAGAEELTDLINRFLEILITTTIPYGGDIQKFGGDAGMLLFEGENHALRAIAASLEVQKQMTAQMGEVSTSLGNFPLRIAIGLGSGRMVGMGLGDREGREWLLTGAPLKAMGRAQEIAPAGGVVVEVVPGYEFDPRVQYEAMGDHLYLVTGLQSPIESHPLAALPAPPQVNPPEYLAWLFSRLDALTPYLAPSLLERLTTTSDPAQIRQWSEHRQVTILMMSLTFPDLSIHWDNPDALQRAVHEPNNTFIRARDIIRQFDGTVNKVGVSPQGAYLMALFGAPLAHEDDPLRAVLAALELQERSDLPLRIGINSGFVFAGNVGSVERREYTVMGDEVNLAYRLMASSEPGQIWLGPNTARLPIIQRRVNGELGAPQKFKGKSGLIVPFVAQSVHRMSSGSDVEEQPLIGREVEMQQFEALLHSVMDGQPQVVALSGPAGVGKTRLVYEVIKCAREMGLQVYEGAAPSYGEHLPYAVWERPLLTCLGLENALQDHRPREFEEALVRYDLNPWGGLLAPLIGLDVPGSPEIMALTPEQREEQRRKTLASLWSRISDDAPTLLILENAHWMPPLSVELLAAFIEQLPQSALMVLITWRDADGAEQAQPWRQHPSVQRIVLDPFPRKMTIALARQVANTSHLPAEVERWLVKRGGGIPLFTVEAVRTLLTSGILAQIDGTDWHLTQPLEEAPLPETAYGMIQSRIDQLEPPSRHLLRAATVVGEQMTVPMLVAGYGDETRPAVLRRLPRLAPLGLIAGDSQGETLIFRQPLIREVAYHGLPYRIRRLVHQRLAAYLDQYREKATSNWLALAAYHAFEGQEWELAVRLNLELGKRAQHNYLLDQATQAFQHVTEAADAGGLAAPEARLEAMQRLGQTLTLFGRYDEALAFLQQARQILPAVPSTSQDIEYLGRLECDIAAVLTNQGLYQEALENIERGLQLPNVAQSIVGAQLQMQKAGILHRQGNYDEEEKWTRSSAEITERLSSEEALKIHARALYLLAYLTSVRGDSNGALELGGQSLEVYQKLQDLVGEMNARNNLVLINLALSNWQSAVEHGERGLKLAQRIRHTEGEARLAANLGEVYRYQGRIQEARLAYNLTLKLAQELGISYGIALMENNLAALALLEKKYEEAQQRLDRAETLFDQIGSETMLPETLRHRSSLALACGDVDAALALAQRSLETATSQGASSEVGRTQRLLAEIYLIQGKCDIAAQAIERAIAAARANQDRYRHARAVLTRARWHKACGRVDAAEQTLLGVIQELTLLGATYDVNRAQTLLAVWQAEKGVTA